MSKKVACLVIFTVLGVVACLDDPDCYNLNNNVVGIAFRKMLDGKADTLAVIGVTVTGATETFSEYTLATGIQIPVNYLEDESTITMEVLTPYGTVSTTTMQLGYTSQAQFVSEDCGERYVVSNLNVLNGTGYDSVRIVSRSPAPTNNSATTNLLIYRCPRFDLIQFGFRQLALYDTEEKEKADSLGTKLTRSIASVTTSAVPALLYEGNETNAVRLPLAHTESASTFDFSFNDGTANTVTVGYEKQADQVFLAKCGPQDTFDALSIATTDFDRAVVLDSTVQDPPVTNIALLRCPDTNLAKIVFRNTDSAAFSQPLRKVTAAHMSDLEITAETVSTFEVPLDISADVSSFVLEFSEGTSRTIDVQYSRAVKMLYGGVCERTVITGLQVSDHNFTADPYVVEANVQFPTVTNIAIVIN